MNPVQFVFRKGGSTADALLFSREPFIKFIDSINIVQTEPLDLLKAFDFIDILKEKLKLIGFDSDAQNLLKSIFSNKLQRVKFDSVYSNWKRVVRGVPQGTVLATLLFNLYVNDFCTAIDTHVTTIQYIDKCPIFLLTRKKK